MTHKTQRQRQDDNKIDVLDGPIPGTGIDLPTIHQPQSCNFEGYDAISLMAETAKLIKLITKRGTFEILIPLWCTTNPVRYLKFRQT